MNTLHDASFPDLAALLACIDAYERESGHDEGPRWREEVFAEMRRRFAIFDENLKMMEAARAAREAAKTGH